MEAITFAVMAALALKLVDFVKFLKNKDVNSVVTQLAVWGAGVLIVFLVAASDFAVGLTVGDLSLNQLNWSSLVLVGLTLGSTGSVAFDFKKSFDNTDSSKIETLLPPHQ